MLKKIFKVIRKILFESGDLRSIRNLVKPAELTQMPGVVEKYNKKRISRDGKNTLKNKSPKHGNKRVSSRPACIRIVVPSEGSGNQSA